MIIASLQVVYQLRVTFFSASNWQLHFHQDCTDPGGVKFYKKIIDQQIERERCQYIASFGEVDLLIIDDLGVERNSEFALEQVYAVIDERYKANLPLIITTNLTPKQMRNTQDIAHSRIYSRVLEMCTPILLQGPDRRKSVSNGKRILAKEILFP